MSDEEEVYVTSQTVGHVVSLAEHIDRVLGDHEAEELAARASVFVLEIFNEMPDQWRQVLAEFDGRRVALAVALGMCTHPENHEFEEHGGDPRS